MCFKQRYDKTMEKVTSENDNFLINQTKKLVFNYTDGNKKDSPVEQILNSENLFGNNMLHADFMTSKHDKGLRTAFLKFLYFKMFS